MTQQPITLSVLDQSPIRKGGTAADAVNETIQLAQAADRLGYRRYWLAEHHSSGALASASPEVLITRVAAATENIRVGSGGVMLSHYSPLKVAETFRMLEALYPGRVDLGIGRAPGSDLITAEALGRGFAAGPENYPGQLVDLYGFLTDQLPASHPYERVRAMPRITTVPELWLLGSSSPSALYAAELGWGFSFAQFISPEGGQSVVRAYRERFKPSREADGPRASIGVSVVCADTADEADYLSWSIRAFRLALRQGHPGPIRSPEDVLATPFSDMERALIDSMRNRTISGTPGQVRESLARMAEEYAVDEFVIVTITYDLQARLRSYELLAEEFGLRTPDPVLSASD
ncbi:MAG: MsnO8 family LLM class oxidoreductase [Dehalococcoidia bacterium]|nr:MsnO8 family LLM class oxidoreductase [Dehalococcoidia bacterium]